VTALAWNVKMDPLLLERHAKILGDGLGILSRNFQIFRREVIAILEPSYAGERDSLSVTQG
jgi:hypothetical protein